MRRLWWIVLLAGCARANATDRSADASASAAPPPASVPLLTIAPVPSAQPVTAIGTCDPKRELRFGLVHFNDLQARYSDRIAGRSRYAYIAGYLKQEKAAQPTLVLDAGDDYEKGAVAELRSAGETTRQMVQALPIDARTIGNHDFAYGEAAVLRDLRLSRHPVLAANIHHAGFAATEQPFKPFVRLDVGCVKVGVIGLVTQSFGADDQPTDAPYDGVFAQDEHYHAVLEREAKAHRAEVDVLIALTHLGYANDLALAHRGGRLCDLIIGGHTEDLLRAPSGLVHTDKTSTMVLQAGHFGEVLGRTDVVVSATANEAGRRKVVLDGYRIVDVDEKLPHADEVDELAKRVEAAVAPEAHTVIGRVDGPVKQGKPMAELVFRAAAATWAVDVAAIGRDLFFTGLAKGDLTLQRLYDAVLVQREPSGTSGFSSLYVMDIAGADLEKVWKGFHNSGYEWLGPRKFDATRRYKLALDKRGATFPRSLFGAAGKMVNATFAGEMIDALEAYAKARTAKGLALDSSP